MLSATEKNELDYWYELTWKDVWLCCSVKYEIKLKKSYYRKVQ